MGDPFLHLDIDAGGIHAMIFENSFSNKKVIEQYHLKYVDLPESETGGTQFQSGMEIIAANMNMGSCSSAVILVSALDICFRNISLPFTNEKKIRQTLPFELAPHLPLPEESYISDFFTQEVKFIQDQQLILSASILESDIEQLVSCLKPFKIKPLVITPTGYAAAVCFLKQRKEVVDFVLIHVDSRVITLTLVADRKPVVVRSFTPIDQTAGHTARTLGQDTLQTILGFRQRSGSDKMFDIFISTKDPSQYTPETLAPLSEILSRQSDSRPLIIEPLDSKKLLSLISPDSPPSLLFNFCRGQFGSEPFFQTYKAGLISTLVILLILFGASLFSIQKDIAILERGIALERQAAQSIFKKTFPDKGNAHIQAPLLLMKSYVSQALKKKGSHTQNQELEKPSNIQAMDVLFELSNNISDTIDIDLSRLILNHGRLIIAGSTNNFNNVDKIKGLIEKSNLFKKVSISSAEAGKKDNRVLFKFIIEM